MTSPRHDFRPAILRAVAQCGRTDDELMAFLDARERWHEVCFDLVRLRMAGKIKRVDGKWCKVRPPDNPQP